MKSIWTTFLLLLSISHLTNGQENNDIYKGGKSEVFRVVNNNLKYPRDDRNAGLEGKVLFKFKIKNGNIDSLEIINSVGPNIDVEAKRVFTMTNGNWLIESNEPLLFPLTFKMDFPGRIENGELIAKRDKLLKKNKFADAIEYCEQLRRRDPFDIDNLSKLILIYISLNQPDNVQKTEYLKKQVQELKTVF